MSTYIEAIYTGHSYTYHVGQTYILEVRQHWFGRISVRPTHGYKYKPIEGMRHTYHNLSAFLANWKIHSIIEPPVDWLLQAGGQ